MLADIVCADAWCESDNGYPSFEEKEGRSLILSRTLNGSELIAKAITSGYISGVEDYRLEALKNIQPYQYNRKHTILARLLPLRLSGVNTPEFIGFSLFRLLLTTSPVVTIKAIAGTLLRLLKGRF